MPVRARARRMDMSSGPKPFHCSRKVLDPPAIVSGDLEDQHIRSRGKNTKQTRFLTSQLQSKSYGLFSTRRGPGEKGESGPTSRAGALLFVLAAARRLSQRLSREAAVESSLGWSRNGGTLG